MANNGAVVRPNPGVLTYTPDGGSGQVLGYSAEGVELVVKENWAPIQPEELADTPLDYIKRGGQVLCITESWQWDAATMASLAGYAVSGSTLTLTADDNGKKATALEFGTLGFVPDTTGHVGWTAGVVVPLLSHERVFRPRFRKRNVVSWFVCFGILPDSANSNNLIALVESS